jgi:hypothetical protein
MGNGLPQNGPQSQKLNTAGGAMGQTTCGMKRLV